MGTMLDLYLLVQGTKYKSAKLMKTSHYEYSKYFFINKRHGTQKICFKSPIRSQSIPAFGQPKIPVLQGGRMRVTHYSSIFRTIPQTSLANASFTRAPVSSTSSWVKG